MTNSPTSSIVTDLNACELLGASYRESPTASHQAMVLSHLAMDWRWGGKEATSTPTSTPTSTSGSASTPTSASTFSAHAEAPHGPSGAAEARVPLLSTGLIAGLEAPTLFQRRPQPLARKFVAGWWSQLAALSLRALRTTTRNSLLFGTHVVTATIAAFAIGSVFHDISSYDDGTAGIQVGILFLQLCVGVRTSCL